VTDRSRERLTRRWRLRGLAASVQIGSELSDATTSGGQGLVRGSGGPGASAGHY
jgi:hypothetical protein